MGFLSICSGRAVFLWKANAPPSLCAMSNSCVALSLNRLRTSDCPCNGRQRLLGQRDAHPRSPESERKKPGSPIRIAPTVSRQPVAEVKPPFESRFDTHHGGKIMRLTILFCSSLFLVSHAPAQEQRPHFRLSPFEFGSMAARCAPGVPSDTLLAIARTESGLTPTRSASTVQKLPRAALDIRTANLSLPNNLRTLMKQNPGFVGFRPTVTR